MASASERAANAASAAQDLLSNPYIRRVVEDPEIRDNARVAYSAAREAIDRISSSDSPASAILDDRKVQRSIKRAGEAALETRALIIEPPRRSHHLARNLVILTAGAVLAIALSEGLRNKVLDLLFGAEEEFDYVPTTAPPAASAQAAAPSVADVASSNGKADSAVDEAAADAD
ncbi:MAG: hypothetical protein F2813_06175 [Actinobacteria bacterium]|nr:hypothetical protein [Actinomycetota bacterium]